MNADDIGFNRRLTLYVLGSFSAFTTVMVFLLGLDGTPYETTDSLGRPMGFNDRFYVEHYLIILGNFAPWKFFEREHFYSWLLATAHIVGACLLLKSGRISTRSVRWFFTVQPFVFFLGVPAVAIVPMFVYGMIRKGMDREGFVDIPFAIMVAQPIWVLTSTYIAIALRGEGLGLKRVWNRVSPFSRFRSGSLQQGDTLVEKATPVSQDVP